jgi:DNA-directed RNA polymerase specialized sigma24 family protein
MARMAEQARLPAGERGSSAGVLEAIDRLRSADREVLKLVLWEGLNHAEAASVLGCSVSAVAQRLHRARERLRSELSIEEDDAQERQAWTSIN